MTKVNGFFETFLDQEWHSKINSQSKVIRIYCLIKFKTSEGFTKPYPAIIDTGAHTSVIPFGIWKISKHKILGDHYLSGLVPGARLNLQVGEITGVVVDILHSSTEYNFACFFSPNDATPLILGFKGLLSRFKLTLDYSENRVWLEEK